MIDSHDTTDTGYSEPFTTEQNDAVYKRLVSGDENARQEMIEGNMALAVHRADAYLRRAPQMAYYRDDMISAGLVGLCQAVDRMQKAGPVKTPRPTGCITRAIDRRIIEVVDAANTVVVPTRVQCRARAQGEPIMPPRTVSERALIAVSDSSQADYSSLALREEILACCLNDTDRQIVTMRSEGYTDTEIGIALGLSEPTISRRRKVIFKRFNQRCPDYRQTQRLLAKKAAKRAAGNRQKTKPSREHTDLRQKACVE